MLAAGFAGDGGSRMACRPEGLARSVVVTAQAKRGGERQRFTSSSDKESLRNLSSSVRSFRSADQKRGRSKPSTAPRKPPPSKGFASAPWGVLELDADPLAGIPHGNWLSRSDSDEETDESVAAADTEELSDTELEELLGRDTSGPDSLAGADPTVEAALSSILSEFAYPLDHFQVKAVRHVLAGRSVVVCAPTGAGKTAIAEAAAIHSLRKGGRVLYTTPLKALSNQKLGEMRERFGVDEAGLLTGDAAINPDGSIVVMTTEILRNMLYGVSGVDGVIGSDRLEGVDLVVFDECHYLGDPSRGSVWEECIINLPPHITILAMSATVRNPEDLCGWIRSVHGVCDVVTTAFRPVPLSWHFCLAPGGPGSGPPAAMLPLLDARSRGINPLLLPPSARWQQGGDEGEGWGRQDGKKLGGGSKGAMRLRTLDELMGAKEDLDDSWHRMAKWKLIPAVHAVVGELRARRMLPAIWFIFSRKECDNSVDRLHDSGMSLTTDQERAAIMAEVAVLQAEQPEAVKTEAVEALGSGLASHHAGSLPGWKSLIERLFQRGLIKVVFATETLAAGINMPARTTLLSALSRRRDAGIAPLTHNELLQMAGRAGRRGYDTQGHCVIVQSRWEGPDSAFGIIRKGPESLQSRFTANYGMVLNLLWGRSLEEAREFLDRSFSRYLSGAGAARVSTEIAALEAKAEKIMAQARAKFSKGGGDAAMGLTEDVDALSFASDTSFDQFEKLQGQRREEKRAARMLRQQLAMERGTAAEALLTQRGLPRAVSLDLSGTNIGGEDRAQLPALAVQELGLSLSGAAENSPAELLAQQSYLCLGADNQLYVIRARHVCAVSADPPFCSFERKGEEDRAAAVVTHAEGLRRGAWRETGSPGVMVADGSGTTANLALHLPSASELTQVELSEEAMEALTQQRTRMAAIAISLDRMRRDKRFSRAAKAHASAVNKAAVLLGRASMLREELQGRLDGGWREFEQVAGVLEKAGALTFTPDGGRKFSPLGMVAREVRCSNELWMAMALTHSALQTLRAPVLAGVVCALVAQDAFNRTNLQVAYQPSADVVRAVEALEQERITLAALQIAAGLDVPLSVDLRMSGIVEGWASGLGWAEVTADCGLDDGDVARLLMRTVDALRQASRCEQLLRPLRNAARAAAGAMDRAPISDLVA